MPFSSPSDFLEHIRFLRASPAASIQGEPNLEFQRIFSERSKGAAMPFDPHEHIIQELWRKLQAVLPNFASEPIRGKLIVGLLDHIAVNALCTRSAEGYVAIVVNSGLLTFLNKISKLQIASIVPDSVIYCNRCAAEDISTVVAKKWFIEVCEHYRVTGKPLGPQIHLTTTASLRHAHQLYIWELFVLAHELGHLAAGHLEDESSWMCNPQLGMAEIYVQSSSHRRETEADILAYLILRECFYHEKTTHSSGNLEDIDDRPLLSAMISLFDLFYLIGSRESHSHPHPLDRICNIVSAIYGESLAETLASSYEDLNLLTGLFKDPVAPLLKPRSFKP